MKKMMFPEPDCRSCLSHDDQTYGRSCNGGKKPRRFKSKDPKRRPPSWCPKRHNPAIIRVYRLKDEQSKYMHFEFKSESMNTMFPMTHHYRKVFSGRADITAKGFWDAAENNEAMSLIDFEIEYGDVVEIDDGFTPYFFYCKTYLTFQQAYFRPPTDEAIVKIRKRKVQHEH